MNGAQHLLTYRYAQIIYDLTCQFCLRYLSHPHDSSTSHLTKERMIHVVRLGKHCMTADVGSFTSKKAEIELLTVARTSFESLLADYEDFLRHRGLPIYAAYDQRVTNFRKLGYTLSSQRNTSDLGEFILKPALTGRVEHDANYLHTLCHLESYLLHKHIASLELRLDQHRGYPSQIIEKRRLAQNEA